MSSPFENNYYFTGMAKMANFANHHFRHRKKAETSP
jgi:hypothetical protein